MTKIQAFAFPFFSCLTLEKSPSRLSKAKPKGAPCTLGHHQRRSAELFSHLSCKPVSAGDQQPFSEESCSQQAVGALGESWKVVAWFLGDARRFAEVLKCNRAMEAQQDAKLKLAKCMRTIAKKSSFGVPWAGNNLV